MTQSTAPRLACVRVGPLTTGTLVAAWTRHGDANGGRPAAWRAVTGTLLAAHALAPARWLESADVIVAPAGLGQANPAEWLHRYPGCAVAIDWTGSEECSLITRSGALRSLAVSGLHGDAGALACAAFVHGWLVAGWPLALLSPTSLRVGHIGTVIWPDAGKPLFFKFGYCPLSGDDRSLGATGPLS